VLRFGASLADEIKSQLLTHPLKPHQLRKYRPMPWMRASACPNIGRIEQRNIHPRRNRRDCSLGQLGSNSLDVEFASEPIWLVRRSGTEVEINAPWMLTTMISPSQVRLSAKPTTSITTFSGTRVLLRDSRKISLRDRQHPPEIEIFAMPEVTRRVSRRW
jgi:hypothetical protein